MTTATELALRPQPITTARRTAFVTGASSGIGAAFAERLARDGYDLMVVARRQDRLDALAKRLRKENGVTVRVLPADLTDAGVLHELEGILSDSPLDLVINCAGVAGYMPFVELPPGQAEGIIRLHVIATTRLTRAALPGMIARGSGAIINVSSLLAFSASLPSPPLPQRVIYASCKSYINTFSEILANELKDTGVQVQVLCPGLVRTEFHDVLGFDTSQVTAILSPEDVVTASLAGLSLGEVVCVPALEDTKQLADLAQQRSQLLAIARSSEIAARYRNE